MNSPVTFDGQTSSPDGKVQFSLGAVEALRIWPVEDPEYRIGVSDRYAMDGSKHVVAMKAGVRFLMERQRADGTWDEPDFTGTGFPRAFMINYHLYRHYFPLMALGRYVHGRTG